MTNAEARCNKSLRPRKPEGSLGRTAQDVHLDSHTAPELCEVKQRESRFIPCLFHNTCQSKTNHKIGQIEKKKKRKRKKADRSKTRTMAVINPFQLYFSACAMDWRMQFAGSGGERVSWVADRVHSCISLVLVVGKTSHFTATRWAEKITAV